MKNKLLIIFFVSFSLYAQESEVVTVVGDSLVGKSINGQNIREVIGNVVITQGNIVINCNRAIQYLSTNEIELIGEVVAVQDTLVIKSEKAFYYGDTKIVQSDTTVYLSQPGMNLKANNGKYYYNEELAQFFGDVVLNDSAFTLTSQELYYFKKSEQVNAKTNVQVMDSTSIIFADSLRHYRNEQISYAFGNVRVDNFENNIIIYGDSLYSDSKIDYSRITGLPLFMQIDTTSSGVLDTLLITSKMMESYNDSTKRFEATDSVKIIRGEFSSINQKSIMYNKDQLIETHKLTFESPQPIIWYENTQLTGDSIYIYLKNNTLDWIDVRRNSLIISKKENYQWRFDQISGQRINMYFYIGSIKSVDVFDNVLSIYYMYEENEPSGLIKSSSQTAKIYFEDGRVVDVRLYSSVMSEYHPESLVEGKEREFTLPQFVIYENRPNKSDLKKLIRE